MICVLFVDANGDKLIEENDLHGFMQVRVSRSHSHQIFTCILTTITKILLRITSRPITFVTFKEEDKNNESMYFSRNWWKFSYFIILYTSNQNTITKTQTGIKITKPFYSPCRKVLNGHLPVDWVSAGWNDGHSDSSGHSQNV